MAKKPHKYIRRYRGKDGKWQYVYQESKNTPAKEYFDSVLKITSGRQHEYFKAQTKAAKPVQIEEYSGMIVDEHEYQVPEEPKQYIARYATHIEDDLKRGWSSWNFGAYGFEGTREELEEEMESAIENEYEFSISGFDLWGDDIKRADIRELYPGYWVLVDNVNAKGGLSFIDLESENFDDAIKEAKGEIYSGEGVTYRPDEIKLVHSINDEIHIFEVL